MEPTFEDFVAARGDALLRLALMLAGDRHHAEGLVLAVRARVVRRRHAVRVVGAAAAAVAMLAGTAIAVAVTSGVPDRTTVVADPDTTGWRWESSLGAEILVPADWTFDDLGCQSTDAPSVVRNPRPEFRCMRPEAATKEVAVLGTSPGDVPTGGSRPYPSPSAASRPPGASGGCPTGGTRA